MLRIWLLLEPKRLGQPHRESWCAVRVKILEERNTLIIFLLVKNYVESWKWSSDSLKHCTIWISLWKQKGVERTSCKGGLVYWTFKRNLPCYWGSPAGLKSGSWWSCERETWIGADTLQLFHSGALGHCNSPTKSRTKVALVQQRWYICCEIRPIQRHV